MPTSADLVADDVDSAFREVLRQERDAARREAALLRERLHDVGVDSYSPRRAAAPAQSTTAQPLVSYSAARIAAPAVRSATSPTKHDRVSPPRRTEQVLRPSVTATALSNSPLRMDATRASGATPRSALSDEITERLKQRQARFHSPAH